MPVRSTGSALGIRPAITSCRCGRCRRGSTRLGTPSNRYTTVRRSLLASDRHSGSGEPARRTRGAQTYVSPFGRKPIQKHDDWYPGSPKYQPGQCSEVFRILSNSYRQDPSLLRHPRIGREQTARYNETPGNRKCWALYKVTAPEDRRPAKDGHNAP